MDQLPILKYMEEVLDEHTIPLEDLGTGMVEAVWLIKMINRTRDVYRSNGS